MSDEMPDWTAMLDQALRSATDVAKLVRAYHLALVAEGFSEEQALTLTLAFQHALQVGAGQ